MRTEILYEDKSLIVARKPAGLATQTAKTGQADMVSELKNYAKSAYLGLVHRLDQPVEGVLVFGKTKAAAANLCRQLSEGALNKRYLAVICGSPAAREGELTDYLCKTPDNRAEIVEQPDRFADVGNGNGTAGQGSDEGRKPQKAVLRYRILESRDGISLADVRIETGRFHQIRAQMSHAGMPLLGDVKYGTAESKELSAALHVRYVALCACELCFIHPATGEELRFSIEPQGEIFRRFTKINQS